MSEETNILLQHFLREHQQLRAKYEELRLEKEQAPQDHSEELGELFAALAKAQTTMEVAGCNKTNPYFKNKYADLKDIIKASRKALSNNNLAVTQQIKRNDHGQQLLVTTLGHCSGQYISSILPLNPPKSDPQTLGSYISYMRRYAYASMCGVVSSDEDDDAEQAMAQAREIKAKKTVSKYNPKNEPYEFITKEQLEELEAELEGYDDIHEEVLEKLVIQSLADMPKSKFLNSIKRIRQIKQDREGK